MSLVTIINSIDTINAAISGIENTYKYPPDAPATPCIYTMVESAAYSQGGSREEVTYDIAMRLIIENQDPDTAEADLRTYMDSILVTYRDSIRLDNNLTNGYARIVSSSTGYLLVGSVWYRMADFRLRVWEVTEVTFTD